MDNGLNGEKNKTSTELKKIGVIAAVVILLISLGAVTYFFRDEETSDGGSDPHVWMSLRKVEKMIEHFSDEISELDPDNADHYEANTDDYRDRLNELHHEIKEHLAPYEGESFMIYHPSIGYFADDYGLEQLAVEIEGKDPGPGQIQGLIDRAEEEEVAVIFVSPQFDVEAAQTIADEIGGRVETLDPLAKDYLDNMEDIAWSLIDAFEEREKRRNIVYGSDNLESSSSQDPVISVAVTIPPQVEWVEEVGGNKIEPIVMVPYGEDPHTYEPEPSRMEMLAQADAYFKLGSGIEFEERHMNSIKNQNPDLEIIDGSRNIELRHFDHDHDHEYEIGEFEIIDRVQDEKVAYVHGDHWHGSLPEVPEDGHISLGAYIEDEDGNEIELGYEYQLGVDHVLDADESIVSFEAHGDHVHISGEKEGTTRVVFQLIHDEHIVYETPPISVFVGDHDHEDEIGEFKIIDRSEDKEVAYVHGDHWHGSLPEVNEGEHVSLGAYIEDQHGHEIKLGDEYQLGVSLAEGAENIVSFQEHGDHVHIHGEEEGSTEVVFQLIHDDHVDYETHLIDVDVG